MIFSAVLNPPPITVRSKQIHRYDRAHERLSHLYESNDLIELHTVTAMWALQAKYMRCILLTFVCSGKYRNKLRQLVCEDVCHAHLSHKDGRIKSLWSQNLPCTGSYVQLSLSGLYSLKLLPLILAVVLIHILLLFFFLSFFRPSPCAPAEQHLRIRQALGRGEVGDTTDWADRVCAVGTIGLIYICDKKSDCSGSHQP